LGRRPNDEKIEVVNIRMVKEPSIYSTEKIRTPDDVLRVIANELATYDREVFAVLNLKTNGQPINLNICSVGTLDSSVVSPREVFKSCILSNSAAFIAIHNHPSGDPTPSEEDCLFTFRVAEAGKMMGVSLLDHIIIGDNSYVSLKERGIF
jgi:DNA repair protein RadC